MSGAWEADVELPPERMAELLGVQFPELAPVRLGPLGAGWDNAAVRVNEAFVFRFPRRKLGAELIGRELRVLPLLAPELPLPIPVPIFAGRPDGEYPYPFAGYRYLPGVTACSLAWTEMQRAASAVPLARFLSALHAVPVGEETRQWAPGDDLRRADPAYRWPGTRERLLALRAMPGVETAALLALGERLASTPLATGQSCWVHGDLYARHLLVDEERRPCGVIDWGDVHLGDPALDLSIGFSFLPPSARQIFRDAYGPIDDAAWDRARFRALFYGVVLTEYGLAVSDSALVEVGHFALEGVLVP